ncbi:hypothetical protein [Aquimarina sp. I32.4]|uniref:hypothetical protein n=1 Tax=Aquimarina sp. I32.4 TaxID=2053903 RepID=UPI000CDEB827|nr:hypothetical protein [Aquimarina sp. I32.4]
MQSLQIEYSKEVARELGKIAVYLPGEDVAVGDILTFPFGKRGLLNKTAPLGSFQRITSLKNLRIGQPKVRQSESPDSYRFTSKKAVQFNFGTKAQADLANNALPKANGELQIKLSAEGAICFFALNCTKTSLEDITALENEINAKGKKMLWEDTYLVTSVTTAQKALIIQSKSNESELTLAGEVQGLQSSSLMNLHANAGIHIKKQKGNMFIKDWSDDVTVFMDLMKFEKETFGTKNNHFSTEASDQDAIRLHPVSISELIEDTNIL